MNKKILIGSILAVLMLMTITYTSAIAQDDPEPKESPLYRIRAKRAVSELIPKLIPKILGERIFFSSLIPKIKSVFNPGDIGFADQTTNGPTTDCTCQIPLFEKMTFCIVCPD